MCRRVLWWTLNPISMVGGVTPGLYFILAIVNHLKWRSSFSSPARSSPAFCIPARMYADSVLGADFLVNVIIFGNAEKKCHFYLF